MISGTVQHKIHSRLGSNNRDGFIGAFFLAALLLVSRLLPLPVNDQIAHIPSVCVFYHLTGLPCPGCGLTRSFVCFAHGEIKQAFAYHPLGPILFLAFAVYALYSFVSVVNPKLRVYIDRRVINFGSYGAIALFLTFWVLRLIGVFPLP
jgi:hypothetical protein